MKLFNGKIQQLNIGDIQGQLFNTFNCDLTSNEGKLGIAPRTILTTDTLSNMTTPVAFKYFDSTWFAIGGRVFKNDGTPMGVFSEDSSSGVPTAMSSLYVDMEVFGDVLLVAGTGQLYSKAYVGGVNAGTGTYTSRRTYTISGDSPTHVLCIYNERAYWVDIRGQIYSMNTSFTTVTTTATDYTFKVPNGQDIVWMRPHAQGIYIGTSNPNGGNSYVYDWDGVTANKWNYRYEVSAQGVLAGYVHTDGLLYIVTSDAELMQLTGAGFVRIARLPIKKNLLYKANSIIVNDRFIHPNGLTAINGNISLLINNRNNSTTAVSYEENIHSGIWEYTEETGLYHKYSFSYKTPTSVVTDYGQLTLSLAGGLANVGDIYATADSSKGNFLAGASYFTDATTVGYGIWTDSYYDNVEKAGFFTTVQFRSGDIDEMWQKVTTILNPTTDNRFDFKYRTTRENPTYFDITWTSQKTFTTTESTLVVGDEVTVIQGKGSGRCAHILSITGSGTYEVTLDQSFGIMSGTAKARRENWKKKSTITSTNRKYDEALIGNSDTWIELKVAMLGTGENVLVEEMILDSIKQK